MIRSLRALAGFTVAAFIAAFAPERAQAQSYPSRTVSIVVPSTAGGGTDTIARLIGDQAMKKRLADVAKHMQSAKGTIKAANILAEIATKGSFQP